MGFDFGSEHVMLQALACCDIGTADAMGLWMEFGFVASSRWEVANEVDAVMGLAGMFGLVARIVKKVKAAYLKAFAPR